MLSHAIREEQLTTKNGQFKVPLMEVYKIAQKGLSLFSRKAAFLFLPFAGSTNRNILQL